MGEENEGSTKCICLFSLLLSSEMAFTELFLLGFSRCFFPPLVQGILDSSLALGEKRGGAGSYF